MSVLALPMTAGRTQTSSPSISSSACSTAMRDIASADDLENKGHTHRHGCYPHSACRQPDMSLGKVLLAMSFEACFRVCTARCEHDSEGSGDVRSRQRYKNCVLQLGGAAAERTGPRHGKQGWPNPVYSSIHRSRPLTLQCLSRKSLHACCKSPFCTLTRACMRDIRRGMKPSKGV